MSTESDVIKVNPNSTRRVRRIRDILFTVGCLRLVGAEMFKSIFIYVEGVELLSRRREVGLLGFLGIWDNVIDYKCY